GAVGIEGGGGLVEGGARRRRRTRRGTVRGVRRSAREAGSTVAGLALGEVEPAAGAALAVLFAFLHAAVAGEEAAGAEGGFGGLVIRCYASLFAAVFSTGGRGQVARPCVDWQITSAVSLGKENTMI